MSIDISVIWFVIIVFATLMYIVMDGFDLGIGMLFSVVHDGEERDVMVNSVAPVWDGNETWLVLGGAGLFGAFPLAYAVITDALVIPLTAMLIGLIFRGVAFEFRFKAVPSHRTFWDYALPAARCWRPSARGLSSARLSTALRWLTAASPVRRWTGLPFQSVLRSGAGGGLSAAGHHVVDHEKRRRAAAADARADPQGTAGADGGDRGGQRLDAVGLALRGGTLVYAAQFLLVRAGADSGVGSEPVDLAPERAPRQPCPSFILTLGLIFLGFSGLGISVWPNIIPPHISVGCRRAAVQPGIYAAGRAAHYPGDPDVYRLELLRLSRQSLRQRGLSLSLIRAGR
jgi:cytochrome d ubiquinol oxidase subunit II